MLPPVVGEFLEALVDPETYAPRRNAHLWFGFAWGLPIPVFSVLLDLRFSGLPLDPARLAVDPVHLIFALHPFLFAVVFGAMGTVRSRKDRHIQRLIDDLTDKVLVLEETNRRMEELAEARKEFLAQISHELKTPLVSVSGYVDMIREERLGPVTAEQERALGVASRNIDRQLGLIEDLLDMARLDAGTIELDVAIRDLGEIAREAAASVEIAAREKELDLEVETGDDPLPVRVDADRIVQVLVNLLGNAVKFTPSGGRVRLRLVPRPAEERVTVCVSDTGRGIPSGHRDAIFERFQQAEGGDDRPADGAGLGLPIVRELLGLHGAEITLRSTPGKGSTFRFELPMAGDAGEDRRRS